MKLETLSKPVWKHLNTSDFFKHVLRIAECSNVKNTAFISQGAKEPKTKTFFMSRLRWFQSGLYSMSNPDDHSKNKYPYFHEIPQKSRKPDYVGKEHVLGFAEVIKRAFVSQGI